VWLSVATVAALVVLKRVAPTVPAALVAVVCGIGVVALTAAEDRGLALVTPVPSGLPSAVLPAAGGIVEVLPGALAIAVMVFLETLAVARSVRRPSEPPIDNEQELVAGGLTNAAGAFFGAMPSAGGFSQTAMNRAAGARTQASALVTVALAVACALLLGPVLSDLPEATLAALVLVAVVGLLSPAELRRYWRVDRLGFWVVTVTALAGLFLGLVAAVGVGVFLTLFLVLVELDRIGVTELELSPDGLDVLPADQRTVARPGLLVARVDGPLYTANVRSVTRKLLALVDGRPGTRVLVVDGTAVSVLTLTVIDQVSELERELRGRDVELWVSGLPPASVETAQATDLWQDIAAAGHVHATAAGAVRAYEARRGDPGEAG
jgi:MFS superfamily sulfate permease-like transporter